MEKTYEKMLEQQVMLLNELEGDVKKEYYLNLFANVVIQSLVAKRKEKKLNQTQIANIMGVKQSYLSKIENLEKIPTLETVAKYFYALKYEISDLAAIVDNASSEEQTDSFASCYSHIAYHYENSRNDKNLIYNNGIYSSKAMSI